MKRGSLPAVLVLWLVVIVSVMKAGEPPSAAAGPFQTLTCGLEYRHDVRKEGPLSIHVLRIHRSRRDWSLHTGLGQGTVYGLEPLDGIVARTAKSLARPVMAAINGDFFVIKPGPYQGDPRGLQIVNGELVSRPAGSSLWVAASGELKIGRVASKLRVVWPDGKTVTPLGLNEARADDAAVLYTPTLGIRPGETPSDPPGTRTKGGRELVLERVEGKALLPIQVGNTYAARVREVHNQGDTPLAPNQMILSLGPKIAPMPPGQPGDVLQLVLETEPDLRGVQTALGAGRILVQDGKLPNLGPADQPRHPRSLIGWNQQYLLFVVVDGRQPKLSTGMTYPEMAALAQQYGCTDAVEMDGGGSSTLWAMGKILNSPSDGKPRAIANGLILIRSLGVEPPTFDITTKKPADHIKATVEKDTAHVDVSSQSGIGGATITLAKGKWPTTVILRLHLRGLESFAVSNGKVKLTGSVLSHSGNTKRLYLAEEGKDGEREPGTEIKVLDVAGEPVKGLPDEGGYFEIKLPKALLDSQPKSLELGWIDFYRG